MQATCKTLWIPFGDGRAARVRIDIHSPVLPTPLEVSPVAAPDETDMEHVLHGLVNDESQANAPFDIGLESPAPVTRPSPVCRVCHGFGFVPSRSDTDTDPCPNCSFPPFRH